MRSRRNRTKSIPLFEALEGRSLLAAIAAGVGPSPAGVEVRHEAATRPTRTALASSTHDRIIGQSVTLTATVTVTSGAATVPTGRVLFFEGKKVVGLANLDRHGRATLIVSTLFLGKHTIRAAYLGGGQWDVSRSSSIVITVHEPSKSLADGLRVATIRPGVGPGALPGQYLKVNYTGYLLNGSKFDSTLDPGQSPLDFQLNDMDVIQGWAEGLVGIKVGEERVLVIPPALGYGSSGQPPSIPPNATLVFIVQFLKFDRPKLVVTGENDLPITNNEPPNAANGTDFGDVKVHSAGASVTFVLTSGTVAPIQPTVNPFIALNGAGAGNFALGQVYEAPDQSGFFFTITFSPDSKGAHKAVVSIQTNDPRTPTFLFTIEGWGD